MRKTRVAMSVADVVRVMDRADCLMNMSLILFSSMPLRVSSSLVFRVMDVKYSDRYPRMITAPDRYTVVGLRVGSSIWGFCIRFSQSSRL